MPGKLMLNYFFTFLLRVYLSVTANSINNKGIEFDKKIVLKTCMFPINPKTK